MQQPSNIHNDQPAPLEVTVFGAGRGVGKLAVQRAVEAGHRVTAVTRHSEQLCQEFPHVRVIQGDALDAKVAQRAVHGADAVVCALGAPALSDSRVCSAGTRVIVDAMKKQRVRRIVALSALGVAETRAKLPFFLRYVVLPTLLRRPFADHERQEAILRSSGLDWTAVRPASLTDRPSAERYAVGLGEDWSGLSLSISRADVADFLVRAVECGSHIGEAVGLSDRRPEVEQDSSQAGLAHGQAA